MNFKAQVAVITGAASGIGLAVAKQLLAVEANVVLLDINKESLEKEFGDSSLQAMLFGIDITDQLAVKMPWIQQRLIWAGSIFSLTVQALLESLT